MHVLNVKKALGRALTGQYVPPEVSSKGFERETDFTSTVAHHIAGTYDLCNSALASPNDHLAKSLQMATEQQALYKSNQAALDHD